MIYFSLNRFYVNIQAISTLINSDFTLIVYASFAAKYEISILLIAAYFETVLRDK
jgi:hypothetical protein